MTNTHYKNTFLSRDERIYRNKLNKIQNDLLQRLYYKPKREFKFLHKDLSAPNIFNKRQLDPIKYKNETNLINNENNIINSNYNNERYNFGTLGHGSNSNSRLRNAFLDEKNNNDENTYNPRNSNKFRNFQKYRIKCLSNSIDNRVYNYPFNQFTYKNK